MDPFLAKIIKIIINTWDNFVDPFLLIIRNNTGELGRSSKIPCSTGSPCWISNRAAVADPLGSTAFGRIHKH